MNKPVKTIGRNVATATNYHKPTLKQAFKAVASMPKAFVKNMMKDRYNSI